MIFSKTIVSRCRQTYICPTVLSPVTTELATLFAGIVITGDRCCHKVNKFSLGVVVANDYIWPVFVTGDKIIVDIMKSPGTRRITVVNKPGNNLSPVTKTLAIIYCWCRCHCHKVLNIANKS
jgi:hypothetical protein